MNLLRIILGIVLPPVGIFLTYGVGTTLFINILLTLLGWLPGSIHAVWAIAKHEEKMHTIELESRRTSDSI
ncbi:MAG: YqaE/Pmp3 family membrane protein [Cyanobacteria bacterium CRU_2_1]|nr:YqaE/Pmp3 family membrane protein [Cyanobacteria bacterium RU_5_0]NJR59089.1 YqaE/Pmp3 family membrane protein [Cyanobacteria bacterium CRU_2_1]